MKRIVLIMAAMILASVVQAQAAAGDPVREHLLMDFGWRFALGHAYDTDKDYNFGTGYFSYFAKAGYGDGPADPHFDDRAWRTIDLPHDWAVELAFDAKGSYSHGFKAMGRNFPENSVGWYRKSFFIPKSDKGRRVSLEFDGVYRDSMVFVNGFYMGREQSGYNNFRYDISDVLHYGENNSVVVRVDATMEEGWFYEGAGIYRHVWLTKTAPLHIDYNGTFVISDLSGIDGKSADVTARTTIANEGQKETSFEITQEILNEAGKTVAAGRSMNPLVLAPGAVHEFPIGIKVPQPKLWSIESPYLYKLVTTVQSEGEVVDRTETPFGIRTITFDPDKGMFLNGKHVELKGTSNHQDHAGVGVALPDALQYFRVKKLKEMGCNAYRCSHNPPTPELLDACDKLGMLVLAENRLMGNSPELLDRLKRMILLDRNHPCVFAWSLGNEEWAVENNPMGTQIVPPTQDFVKRLDPTRRVTAADSGGWGEGTSKVIDLMGFNYYDHGSTDEQHKNYPNQPSMGSEESDTHQTRGIYEDDKAKTHMAPNDLDPNANGIEKVWKYYMARPYLSGLFLWTGFDYRGEETPFTYPAISSQFGVLDLCGFPKDCFDYLKAWWTEEPVVLLSPHWNWAGREGKDIKVRAFSNCDEVELFLNGKSLGKQTMPIHSHLEWTVPYEAGILSAKGYKDGKAAASAKEETAQAASAIALSADRTSIHADGEDVSVITVEVKDAKGRPVPTAANEIEFTLEGPGKIIGVGNGDPSCHEPDRYVDTVSQVKIANAKMKDGGELGARTEVQYDQDDSNWAPLFQGRPDDQGEIAKEKPAVRVIRASFELPHLDDYSEIILFPKGIVDGQSVYVNGHLITEKMKREDTGKSFPLAKAILKKGHNVYAVVGTELLRRQRWENLNGDPGSIRTVIPAPQWKRSLFSGLAQVIVQSEKKPGNIILKASSKDLRGAELKLEAQKTSLRPALAEASAP